MNIIISGAGKVGFNLAKVLSIGHSVTLVDKNAEALSRIHESLDVLTIHGNSEDYTTYEKIKDRAVNLFIAVTNDDNVNLVSLLSADIVLDIERKMVRIKKNFFYNEEMQKRLDIEKIIFSIDVASKSISKLLEYPETNNVKLFKYTQYKLISIRISPQFTPKIFHSARFPIIGIERSKEFFITPYEGVEVLPNDLVYFFALKDDINSIYEEMEIKKSPAITKCALFGAGDLGIAIAKELIERGCSVKLIEKDLHRCEKADEELGGKASIINTKYGSHDVFKSEGLHSADIFVTTTSDDEFNIVKSLEAKESGIQKVIAINNDIEYYNLMHLHGIVAVRGPKITAYNTIIEEINSSNVIFQKSFCGLKGVLFIRKIYINSHLIGKKIKPLQLKSIALYFIREDILYPFEESIILEKDDLIIAFTLYQESQEVKEWFYGL